MLNEIYEDLSKQNAKKKTLYDKARKFQIVQITCLPWAKSMIDEKGEMHQFKSKLYKTTS